MNQDDRPGAEGEGRTTLGWCGCVSVSAYYGAFGGRCAFEFEVITPSRRSFDCLKRLTLETWSEQKLGSLKAQKKKIVRMGFPD